MANGNAIGFKNIVNQDGTNIRIIGSENYRYREWKTTDIGTWNESTLTINLPNTGSTYILEGYYQSDMVALNQWDLDSIDELRDNILLTKGNVTFDVTGNNSIPLLKDFKAKFNNDALQP